MWIFIIIGLWVVVGGAFYLFDDYADSSYIPLSFLFSLAISPYIAMGIEAFHPKSADITKIETYKVQDVTVNNGKFVAITDNFKIINIDNIIKSDKKELKVITQTQTGVWDCLIWDKTETIFYGEIK